MNIGVYLRGGLGNQMFQYAAAKALAVKNHCDLFIDLSSYNDQSRKYPYPPSILNYNLSAKVGSIENCVLLYEGKYDHYDLDLKKFPMRNVKLNGYWQSEKYFKDIREQLLIEFTCESFKPQVFDLDAEFVAVHIRRGERVSDETARSSHGLIRESYYRNAIDLMEQFSNMQRVYAVFSDDIGYVKDNSDKYFPPGIILTYIDTGTDYHDLHVLSLCSHAIIANSSFSWWGAWLIKNPEKIVIAPSPWVKDKRLVNKDIWPEGWIKIDTVLK